jgi:hypothetical protein
MSSTEKVDVVETIENGVEEVVDNTLFFAIKTSDIVYVTILYFIVGYGVAVVSNTITNTVFGKDYTSLSNTELIFQIVFQIILSHILAMYSKKNIIDKIPFPLDGLHGFHHHKLKELIYSGGFVWSIGIMFYQKPLVQKVKILRSKFKK